MNGPIFLNVPEARAFFEANGFVYSLRRERGTGPAHARVGGRYKSTNLGPVTVTLIAPLWFDGEGATGNRVLEEFLPQSGFRSVEEWKAAASPGATHLYLVERRPA